MVFYCTVAASGFLSLLYQKLTSDRFLNVLVFSFLIFKSGLITFRVCFHSCLLDLNYYYNSKRFPAWHM